MTSIALNGTRGRNLVALIDDEDLERVSQYKWYVLKTENDKPYVFCNKDRRYLHRFIMNAPKGVWVDHRNGDTLDCRKDNLRFCTGSQNNQNKSRRRHKLRGNFKGVHYNPRYTKPWRVVIVVKGQQIQLGTYEDEVTGAKVYDQAALHYFGAFAKLNFPPSNSTVNT